MLASSKNGTLYLGVTSNLLNRIHEHKEEFVEGFTKKYHVDRLVWYESHATAESAITREKRIKKWKRAWKIELIEESNPAWQELYEDLL
jgi:putative endonuclease